MKGKSRAVKVTGNENAKIVFLRMSWPDVLHFILSPVSVFLGTVFFSKLNSPIYIATFVAVACTNFLLHFVRAVS